MARYLIQLIVAGSQVVGRAFARAIRQEIEASQQAAERLNNTRTRTERVANQKHGISLDEAKQILNLDDYKDTKKLEERYEHLFKVNDKQSGGSFYIQSKVVRAKERIEHELSDKKDAEKAEKT